MKDDELVASTFGELRGYVSGVIDAVADMREQNAYEALPASLAAAELGNGERGPQESWGREPTETAFGLAGEFHMAAGQLLGAVEQLLQPEDMKPYGLEVVARPQLIACARAWYLSREEIGVRVRVALGINELWGSVGEQAKLRSHDANYQSRVAEVQAALRNYVAKLGLQEKLSRKGELLGFVDGGLGMWPYETDLTAMFTERLGIEDADEIYRYLSGFVHLRHHAIRQHLGEGEPNADGVSLAKPRLALESVIRIVRLCLLSYLESGIAIGRVNGWSGSEALALLKSTMQSETERLLKKSQGA